MLLKVRKLNTKGPKRERGPAHQVTVRGVLSNGQMIPYGVALVDALRKEEIRAGAARSLLKPKNLRSIAEIRREVMDKKMKKRVIESKGIAEPIEFIRISHTNSDLMLSFIETFLTTFVRGKKTAVPRTPFDIADRLRPKLSRVPEGIIQSYSNWLYAFTRVKGNRAKLVAFRKKILQGKV